MRFRRRLLSGTMAAVMLLGVTTSALAATHEVGSYDALVSAVENDNDSKVDIILTDDIDATDGVTLKNNTNYTIKNQEGGATGSSYTLNGASFSGNGTLTIETDVNGTLSVNGSTVTVNGDITADGDYDDGVYAENGANVTVNGDITATDDGVDADGSTVTVNGSIDAGDDGVDAEDSTVTVTGNIDAGDDGVEAYDSTVTVTGNIDADYGVYANEGSDVTVNGDINAEDDGVLTYDSTVTVTGDITAGDDGVDAEDSTVTVTGNITAKNDGVYTENSIITVNGNITAEGDDGVDAEDSTVTVNGDITAGDDGVHAYDSTVTVNGNVKGGDGDPDKVDFDDPSDYSDGGDGVYASGSTVTVTGSVTGGNSYGTYGYGGCGVRAWYGSTVIVYGDAIGGNVIAKPETEADEDCESEGGHGVYTDQSCTVYIGGSAIGGDTNGDSGRGGSGVCVEFCVLYDEVDSAKLTVVYRAVGGTSSAANGTDGAGLLFDVYYGSYGDNKVYDTVYLDDVLDFVVEIGEASSIGYGEGLDESDLEAIIQEMVKVVGLPVVVDFFWYQVCRQIKDAQPGDTITVDAGARTVMPAYVMEALRDSGVTLVIQWDGGEDIVIDHPYDGEEVYNVFRLEELADLLAD